MRVARITTALLLMAAVLVSGSTTIASSANPVGDDFCDTPFPASGDFCIGKNDAGYPWADWSGDNVIQDFDDWRYYDFPTTAQMMTARSWMNGDQDAQWVYEDRS